MPTDRVFTCWDDSGCEVQIEAPDAETAAREYVDGGDWYESDGTWWCSVWTEGENGQTEKVKVAVEPAEPKCEGDEHDWQSPHEIVGGIAENPGVFGHGGGVTIHEVCSVCGCGRILDTWAQDPTDGEQGLRSVRYLDRVEFAEAA